MMQANHLNLSAATDKFSPMVWQMHRGLGASGWMAVVMALSLSCEKSAPGARPQPPSTQSDIIERASTPATSDAAENSPVETIEKPSPEESVRSLALSDLPQPDAKRMKDGVLEVSWGNDADAQGRFGVVTSVEEHATRAGVQILEAGGNAVDAAVATALALAVTHPSAGNLGGGGFLLAKMDSEVDAIDFREDAPRALTKEAFWGMIRAGAKGPRAVGVPGTVYGLHLAHERNGRLPWADVVAPAYKLARQGFRLGLRQAQTLLWAQNEFMSDPIARETFYQNKPWLGVQIVQPRLALALERIANEGRRGFYEGETARDLVASLGEKGLITLEDLAGYEAKIREPLFFDFYDLRVITMPPPSAGGVALTQNLLMLQALDVAQLDKHGGRRVHLIAEAGRRSQVERQLFVVAPDSLSPEEQVAQRARALDPMTWLADHPISPFSQTLSSSLHPAYRRALSELPHTTHLSVTDKDGNAVSCTVTLSGSFGARIMTRETGIVLNNSVASFSSMGENTPAPAQRTTSSMAPTLALLGPNHLLVLGSPGGNTIPDTITQTLLQVGLDDEPLAEAVKKPRVHQGFAPQYLQMERYAPLPASVQKQLRQMGHEIRFSRNTMGDANIAAYSSGMSYAVADRREGGLALAATDPEGQSTEDVAASAPASTQAQSSALTEGVSASGGALRQ